MQWKTNKLRDLREQYVEQLSTIYSVEESNSLLAMLIKRYFNISRSQLAVHPEYRLSESEILRLHFAVKELLNHRPIQYILKHVDFLNTRILVDESVLIPRPETEELVQLVIEKEKTEKGLQVLDVGTGSGCIAIALAKNLADSKVTAVDVSEEALKTASKNIFVNEVMVHFEQFDILDPESNPELGSFDIIVSNPPYVTMEDKQLMKEHVLKHEPHLALFVEGSDPLLFYKAILYFAHEHHSAGGRIYFEINEKYGEGVSNLMKKHGYSAVEIHADVFDKPRFVSGIKQSFER
jgi:release factor glutamine methyltransferase